MLREAKIDQPQTEEGVCELKLLPPLAKRLRRECGEVALLRPLGSGIGRDLVNPAFARDQQLPPPRESGSHPINKGTAHRPRPQAESGPLGSQPAGILGSVFLRVAAEVQQQVGNIDFDWADFPAGAAQ